jgi:hypothetical protein
MTALQQIERTNPATVTAFVGLAAAYERLWLAVDTNPADKAFVSKMLGMLHGASVIPRMEQL